MIKIIGFKLLTEGRDIQSTSNVEWNMIPDGGSYISKSLAGQTFGKMVGRVGGILRATLYVISTILKFIRELIGGSQLRLMRRGLLGLNIGDLVTTLAREF